MFDGPPHSMAGTLEIARGSDIVVLPGLSLDDLKPTVLLAHELVEAGLVADKIAVGLCRVGSRENEIEEARRYIDKAGYSTLKGALPKRPPIGARAMKAGLRPRLPFRHSRRRPSDWRSIIDLVGTRQSREVA